MFSWMRRFVAIGYGLWAVGREQWSLAAQGSARAPKPRAHSSLLRAASLPAMALALLFSSTAAAAAPPFSALAIKRTDLPQGYLWVSAQTLQAPATTTWFPRAVDLRGHGYQISYMARFVELVPHTRPPQMKGVFQEMVDRYGTGDGGHWGYQGRLSQRYPRASLLALKTVGNESSAWKNLLGQAPFNEVEVLFRQGGYVVELHCGGTIDQPATCLHYAKLVDARIKAKG